MQAWKTLAGKGVQGKGEMNSARGMFLKHINSQTKLALVHELK